MSDRGLTTDVANAIGQLRKETRPYWEAFSPPIAVTFPAANNIRDVAHELGQVPDGYHVVWADGIVYAEPGKLWTKDLAYLRATSVNVHATIVFFTLKEARNET